MALVLTHSGFTLDTRERMLESLYLTDKIVALPNNNFHEGVGLLGRPVLCAGFKPAF